MAKTVNRVSSDVIELRVSLPALAALNRLPKWVNQNPFLARVLTIKAIIYRVRADNDPLGPLALGRSQKIIDACQRIRQADRELKIGDSK